MIYPKNKEETPVLRYVPGDSVSFTAAESIADFDELVGNHIRDADIFYDFIPILPSIEEEDEYKKVPLFAVKVTVFPGRGICIGIANSHCLGDASSIFRSAINDPLGIDKIFCFRSTFTLSPDDIKKLKEIVLAKKPGLSHVSSFVVSTCHSWVCFVRSGDAPAEEANGDALEVLGFPVDVRSRVDPPVPDTYFGNCLAFGYGMLKYEQVISEDGFATAAEVIAEHIKNRVNKKGEVMKDAENWFSQWSAETVRHMRPFGISGSPRFDFYGAHFGWGRGRKVEALSIDSEEYAFSFSKWMFPEAGGLEIGLSLPEKRMKAFAAIFADGLNS